MNWLDKLSDKMLGKQTDVDKELGDLTRPKPKQDPNDPPKRQPKKASFLAMLPMVAALLLAGCNTPVQGTPTPRAPYSEDADRPDYVCQYDGNGRCPTDGSVNR